MQSRNGKLIVPAVILFFAVTGARAAPPPAPEVVEAKIAAQIRTAILRLPYYGVFDLVSFEVNGDTVTLGGYVYRGTLKEEAQKAVAKIPGVARVVNGIQILPTSIDDDQIRSAAFNTIYTDDFLSRYGTPVSGLLAGHRLWGSRAGLSFGPTRVRTGGLARFPYLGMEPLGNYAIHIIVDQGTVDLFGVVDSDADRTKAGLDVRQILGVRSLNNEIQVVSETRHPKA